MMISAAEIGILASVIFEGIMRRYDDSDHIEHFNYHHDRSPFRFILNCSRYSSCKRLKKEVNDGREPDIPSVKVMKGHNVMIA